MADFVINGSRIALSREDVERAMAKEDPEPIRAHTVTIAGRTFPPKQVLERSTNLDRADFTTNRAREVLRRLGFELGRVV